jgi:hypothetical protein
MEAAEVEAPVGAVALTEAGVEVPVRGAGAEEVVVAAVAITKDHWRGPCSAWGKSAGLPLVSGIWREEYVEAIWRIPGDWFRRDTRYLVEEVVAAQRTRIK